jgi:hypothetical protein
MKSMLVKAKSNIQQEEDPFHQQIGLTFKEVTSEVVHLDCCFYGAETWILRRVD